MNLPDFVIVGAMKAATSSFAVDLSCHPDVYMPPGEVHFFNSEGNYARGLDYYNSFFAHAPAGSVIGEKTPAYSHHPKVPQRLADALPNVKIIWLLREPISRTFSHYNFFIGKGREWRSFDKAIHRELSGQAPLTQRYLARSIYIEQIQSYLEYFPMSQMKFLLYEDYKRNKMEVLSATCKYLGIVNFAKWPEATSSNLTYMPHNYFLQRIAYHYLKPKSFRIYKLVSDLNRRPQPGYKPMDKTSQSRLTDFFKEYNRKLAELTGLDLSIWNEYKTHAG